MVKRLGIMGAGGHAKVVADTAKRCGGYVIHGFYDDNPALHGMPFYHEYMIMGDFEQLLRDLKHEVIDTAFIAIGHNKLRQELGERILDAGYVLETLVDSTAILSPTVQLGAGSLVVVGAIINADAQIGKHAIVNTGATIDHDCIIHDAVHIAPQAALCGSVEVGERTLIGVGAVLIPNVSFPKDSILGAGSVMTTSTYSRATYYGVPSRKTHS